MDPLRKQGDPRKQEESNGRERKKARIFSKGLQARSRAVVFNATNYFDGNDEFNNFNEPIAPVLSQTTQNERIRQAHQCHESGESNQMDTDIEYFMGGLDKEQNNNEVRCLSVLGLSAKVMSVEYRMHVKAHDYMPKIMTRLVDAPNDPNLALSCATLMFIHNQDRMSSDIDPTALEVTLNLINGGENVHNTDKVEKKHKDKVLKLIAQLRENGHAKHLETHEITAANLATETLLSLNSKRLGDWFKEELLRLKGTDFILETIATIAQTEDLETNDALLSKLERCMNLLEDITCRNRCNQEYIIKYNDGILIDSCLELLTLCKREITVAVDENRLKLFTKALIIQLKVLINITSENEKSSSIGSRFDLIDLVLYFIHELQSFIEPEERSDIIKYCIILLLNMVEYNTRLRSYLMNESNRIHDLIDTFYKYINDAEHEEQRFDQILDAISRQDTMTRAMVENFEQQAGERSEKHLEHCSVAACLATFFGCIIQDNPDYREQFISYLHDNSVAPLVDVLQKLHKFVHTSPSVPRSGIERVERCLKLFNR